MLLENRVRILKNIHQPFGFIGEQADLEAGLIYLRMRYYDPTLGRFLSSDKWPIQVYRSQSMNHVYVENNPVNSTHPSGMTPKDSDSDNMMYSSSMGSPTHLDPRIKLYERLYGLQLAIDVFNTAFPEIASKYLDWLWMSGNASSSVVKQSKNISTIGKLDDSRHELYGFHRTSEGRRNNTLGGTI